ncbi:MAG: 4-oxalocrotonate tautomerase family protein [Tetrasphaera sp.]|jgi:4-oxalocrotonate tautomerase|nr:4-oxalocrotonate tautomerase family protein [Tetrasphaera sp.]
MPFIDVTLVEGRTPEQLRTLITKLTDAAVEAVGAPRDSIRVVLREVAPTHWAAGDVTIAERRAAPPPG